MARQSSTCDTTASAVFNSSMAPIETGLRLQTRGLAPLIELLDAHPPRRIQQLHGCTVVRLRPLSEETVRELLCALPAKVQMQVRGQGYSLRWDGELSSWTPKPTRRPETVLLWSEGHRGLERLVCVRPGRRLGRISLGDGMTARVFSTEVEHHTGLARPYLSGRWYDLPERQSLRIEVCGAVKDSNLRRALGDARALELLDEAEKLLLETR